MAFANHPALRILTNMGALGIPKRPEPVLDSAVVAAQRAEMVLDSADTFAEQSLRLDVAAAVQEWAGTTAADLDEGETMAARLLALLIGIADENKDGDIAEVEEVLVSAALESAADYLMGKGVSEDDVVALLNDEDSEAAGRVVELLREELPQDEDGSMADVDSFAFDSESSASLFDAVLDAVYKKKIVVRGGRKVRINKRVSGKVILSAGQKIAIRKARRKAHSASARMRRAKSMKMRARSGLK